MMFVAFSSLLSQQEAAPVVGGGYEIGSVATCDEAESISLVAPAGSASGDLLVLMLFLDSQRALTVPADWTQLERVTQSFGSDRQIYIATKVADGDSTDSPTITHGVSTDRGLILSFPAGATVLDSQAGTSGSTSNPPSNDGTMSGGSGDWVIWGLTGQTGVIGGINGFPTPSDDTVGPTINGNETFALGVAELTASVTNGLWSMVNSDHRYLASTVVITP